MMEPALRALDILDDELPRVDWSELQRAVERLTEAHLLVDRELVRMIEDSLPQSACEIVGDTCLAHDWLPPLRTTRLCPIQIARDWVQAMT